jgi:hypothetical protein
MICVCCPANADGELVLSDGTSARLCSDCLLDKASRRRVVYFIQAGNLVKIGFSGSVAVRMHQLQTASSETLSLVKAIEGDHALERDLHRRFGHLRSHREWFRSEGDLADFISCDPERTL